MKLCKCEDEQIEVPTYGDAGTGRMPFICAGCGGGYSEPHDWGSALGVSAQEIVDFIESEDFRRRARHIGVTSAEALGLSPNPNLA